MIGSLRTRSSSTPACSDTSANGSVSSATRMPICSGVACSSSAAVSGSARLVICAPNAVTVSDSHSRRKSGSRHRPRRLRRAVRASCSKNFIGAAFCRADNAHGTGWMLRRKLRKTGDFPLSESAVPGGHPRGSYAGSGRRRLPMPTPAPHPQCIAAGSGARTSARRRGVKANESGRDVMGRGREVST